MSDRSLAWRAAWLVGMAVGFWALAVTAVVGLFLLGRWIIDYAPGDVFAGFGAWALAVALIIGLLPRRSRRDRAHRLRGAEEPPALRALVREVAARAGGQEPDVVFLAHDANAFASARKPSFFSRRETVVGVGLPLLGMLTPDELRSVVAHEMGHHLAADVKLEAL